MKVTVPFVRYIAPTSNDPYGFPPNVKGVLTTGILTVQPSNNNLDDLSVKTKMTFSPSFNPAKAYSSWVIQSHKSKIRLSYGTSSEFINPLPILLGNVNPSGCSLNWAWITSASFAPFFLSLLILYQWLYQVR